MSDEKVAKFAENLKDKEISNTIRCGGSGSLDGKHTFDIVFQKDSYRRLTPKECWYLMGFTDDEFEKAKESGVSNTQLYKQAGNSIVVNVLEAIFRQILC